MMDTLFSLEPEPCAAQHCTEPACSTVDVPWHYLLLVRLCEQHTIAVARGEEIPLKHQPKLMPIPFGVTPPMFHCHLHGDHLGDPHGGDGCYECRIRREQDEREDAA